MAEKVELSPEFSYRNRVMTPASPTTAPSPAGIGVSLSGLGKTFGEGRVVLRGIDLRIEPGEFVSVLGPSGCGKSTLLRLISGLERPSAGQLSLSGSGRPEIAFVFQEAHLLPWRNVLENVQLPLEFRGATLPERRRLAEEALDKVGLTEATALFPNQLSGGMKMRVSLARALVTRPKLLILDEPFAALDEVTRQRLDEELRTLWRSMGMTVIFVTHSITEAVFLSGRVLLLSAKSRGLVAEHRCQWAEPRGADLRVSVDFARTVQKLQQEFESLAP